MLLTKIIIFYIICVRFLFYGVNMKFILKTILLISIALFALIDYRCLSIEKGRSIVETNNKKSITAIEFIESIPTKIEYYKKTINNSEYDYKIYIETNDKNYLFDATYEQIQTLDVIGLFAKDIKPQEIKPIPFYIEIVVGFIILIIPFGKKQENNNTKEKKEFKYY